MYVKMCHKIDHFFSDIFILFSVLMILSRNNPEDGVFISKLFYTLFSENALKYSMIVY